MIGAESAQQEGEYAAFTAPAVGIAVDPGDPEDVRRAERFLRHLALAESACLRLACALCPSTLDPDYLAEPRDGGSQASQASAQAAAYARAGEVALRRVSRVIDSRFATPDVRAGSAALAALASGSVSRGRETAGSRLGLPLGAVAGL